MFQLIWSENVGKTENNVYEISAVDDQQIIEKTSFLLWEEHCVECAPLEENATCLHSRRKDNECESFVNGISENKNVPGTEGHSVEMEIKRWGKLETQWSFSPKMYKVNTIRNIVSFFNIIQKISKLLYNFFSFFPKSYYFNKLVTSLLNRSFKFLALEKNKKLDVDGLLLEFYINDYVQDNLVLEIIKNNKPIFKHKINFQKGWNKELINFSHLGSVENTTGLCRIWIGSERQTKILFKTLNLVKFKKNLVQNKVQEKKSADKVKCVVFDLDNTLWKGVIGDDGDQVIINEYIVDFIKKLDEKGIVCSISSKNNFDTAWDKIKEMKMSEYFLCPQINWKPKSLGIMNIAKKLNIGIDSIALIDDSDFEKREVSHAYPEVRLYDPSDVKNLLLKDEFNIKITEQSKVRRQSYIDNFKRQEIFEKSSDGFEEFLLQCNLKLKFYNTKDKFERVYELASRTNQFNTSGKKFEKIEFEKYIKDYKTMCFEVYDKYGSYGIVGFLSFKHNDKKIIIDQFILSCRVAEKTVEETIIKFLFNEIKNINEIEFNFIETKKNMPIKNKLESLNFVKSIDASHIKYSINFKEKENIKNFIEIENQESIN